MKLSVRKDEVWLDDYLINTTPFEIVEGFLQDMDLMLWRGEIPFKTYQILTQSIFKNLN
jgi:hypothetical protein